jgi:hypothetical protein
MRLGSLIFREISLDIGSTLDCMYRKQYNMWGIIF